VSDAVIRRATTGDVPRIIELIVDGAAAGATSDELPPTAPEYLEAFHRIDANPAQTLVVADDAGAVIGTLLFTAIQQIAHGGRPVAMVENVHVASAHRSRGVGGELMRWAIDEARRRGCHRLQLTSNNVRADAHRFYRRLGFVASHTGMRLAL